MEHLHTVVILTVIVAIMYYQISTYRSTILKLKIFRNIFPKQQERFALKIDAESGLAIGIECFHDNVTLRVIINSINNYLGNNKGAISDFHLLKDIVDRNCDTAEEEINTQIPIPLYYGLMGTMAGILIGVGFLVFSGDLSDLLGNSTSGNGSSGINALLEGVALAMISSILGIFLTTIGSTKVKESKVEMDTTKNNFLSWIQAKLLPELTSDMSSTLNKMTKNLASFNSTFSVNTQELRSTLALVNESYKGQAEVLNAINKLKIAGIAKANIEVYDKLKNCTDEIGHFGTYLRNVNDYISNINKLNEKLDGHDNRTRAIEDMGTFFKEERANMQVWNGIVTKSIGEVDGSLQNAVYKLKESVSEQFNDLVKHTTKQREGFEKAVDEQQETLVKKVSEMSKIVEELKNLTAVKTSMANLEKATIEQNRKIDKLIDSIRELAQLKSGGGNPVYKFPRWVKISATIGGSFLILTYLFYITIQLYTLISKL